MIDGRDPNRDDVFEKFGPTWRAGAQAKQK
jgi:hypothetical protein